MKPVWWTEKHLQFLSLYSLFSLFGNWNDCIWVTGRERKRREKGLQNQKCWRGGAMWDIHDCLANTRLLYCSAINNFTNKDAVVNGFLLEIILNDRLAVFMSWRHHPTEIWDEMSFNIQNRRRTSGNKKKWGQDNQTCCFAQLRFYSSLLCSKFTWVELQLSFLSKLIQPFKSLFRVFRVQPDLEIRVYVFFPFPIGVSVTGRALVTYCLQSTAQTSYTQPDIFWFYKTAWTLYVVTW